MKSRRHVSLVFKFVVANKVKKFFGFSFLNYLQAGVSFLVSIFLAKYLGTEGYGQYAFGLIFANTLMTLMQFGTERTLVRDLVQLKNPDAVLSAASLIWLVIGILGLICVAVWAFFISNIHFNEKIVVVLCTGGGVAQGLTVSGWFDFKDRMSLQSFYGVLGRFFFLLGAFVTVFLIADDYVVVWAALFLLLSRILSLALEWQFVAKTAVMKIEFALPYLRQIINSNIWVWWASIGNLLMTQTNQFILKNKVGPSELAYYSLAFQSVMLIQILQKQITRIIGPSVANVTSADVMNSSEILKKWMHYSAFSFLVSLLLLAPLYFLTPLIVMRFLGVEYLPAVPVMNTLYVWTAIFGAALINNQFLIGLRMQRSYFKITLLFGFISVILAFPLISKYQAQGAALSLLISHFCSIFFQIYIVIRSIRKMKTH